MRGALYSQITCSVMAQSFRLTYSNESNPWLGGFGLTRWFALIATMLEFHEANGPTSFLAVVILNLEELIPADNPASSEFARGGASGGIDPPKLDRVLISNLKSPSSLSDHFLFR
jgi:hypothetical protein